MSNASALSGQRRPSQHDAPSRGWPHVMDPGQERKSRRAHFAHFVERVSRHSWGQVLVHSLGPPARPTRCVAH